MVFFHNAPVSHHSGNSGQLIQAGIENVHVDKVPQAILRTPPSFFVPSPRPNLPITVLE